MSSSIGTVVLREGEKNFLQWISHSVFPNTFRFVLTNRPPKVTDSWGTSTGKRRTHPFDFGFFFSPFLRYCCFVYFVEVSV
jgi:hypothetical protein